MVDTTGGQQSNGESSLYAAEKERFKRAADTMDLDDRVRAILAEPRREIIYNVPVMITQSTRTEENGRAKSFLAYRVQFNNVFVSKNECPTHLLRTETQPCRPNSCVRKAPEEIGMHQPGEIGNCCTAFQTEGHTRSLLFGRFPCVDTNNV